MTVHQESYGQRIDMMPPATAASPLYEGLARVTSSEQRFEEATDWTFYATRTPMQWGDGAAPMGPVHRVGLSARVGGLRGGFVDNFGLYQVGFGTSAQWQRGIVAHWCTNGLDVSAQVVPEESVAGRFQEQLAAWISRGRPQWRIENGQVMAMAVASYAPPFVPYLGDPQCPLTRIPTWAQGLRIALTPAQLANVTAIRWYDPTGALVMAPSPASVGPFDYTGSVTGSAQWGFVPREATHVGIESTVFVGPQRVQWLLYQ